MSDTGFVIAGAGATVSGSDTAWTNASNITADDNVVAKVTFASSGNTNALKGSSFGLSIPSSAIITGIEPQFQLLRGPLATATITSINIGKDDSTLATPVTPGTGITSTMLNYTAGGDGSLWGLTWTVSEVEASTFQIRLICAFTGTGTIQCDAAWVKVYYTASTGAKSQSVMIF